MNAIVALPQALDSQAFGVRLSFRTLRAPLTPRGGARERTNEIDDQSKVIVTLCDKLKPKPQGEPLGSRYQIAKLRVSPAPQV